MRTEYLVQFIDLAKTHSFTETAQRFYLSQPTLSKHMTELENEVGEMLLVRTSHMVGLTAAGEIAVERFKRIVDEYDRALEQIARTAQGVEGHVTIGMLYYATEDYIDPLIDIMATRYPGISISVKSGQPHQVAEMLRDDEVDLGLVVAYEFDDQDEYTLYPLRREKAIAMMSADHELANRESLSWADLEGRTFLTGSKVDRNARFASRYLKEHGITAGEEIVPEQVDVVPHILRRTDGILVAMDALRHMNRPGLACVDIDDENAFFTMCYAYKRANENPAIPPLLHAWSAGGASRTIQKPETGC